MPIVDMTSHACAWCGTLERVFLCEACSRYTCRDCLAGRDEAGCYHKKHEVITSQDWTKAQDKILYG